MCLLNLLVHYARAKNLIYFHKHFYNIKYNRFINSKLVSTSLKSPLFSFNKLVLHFFSNGGKKVSIDLASI